MQGVQNLAMAVDSPTIPVESQQPTQLIDNFDSKDTLSPLGTRWLCFTDRVMGGVSMGEITPDSDPDFSYIRMTGEVSLENNGGFVQMALRLGNPSRPLNAGDFDGIRLTLKGRGDQYYMHLRTRDLARPWQYYAASLTVSDEWTTIEIPFNDFTGESTSAPLAPEELTRLGIVAAKEAGDADIAVAHVEFYKN